MKLPIRIQIKVRVSLSFFEFTTIHFVEFPRVPSTCLVLFRWLRVAPGSESPTPRLVNDSSPYFQLHPARLDWDEAR